MTGDERIAELRSAFAAAWRVMTRTWMEREEAYRKHYEARERYYALSNQLTEVLLACQEKDEKSIKTETQEGSEHEHTGQTRITNIGAAYTDFQEGSEHEHTGQTAN